jgi:preprotein translocase subunit SecF
MNQPVALADAEAALRAQGISVYRISRSGANEDILEIRVPGLSGDDRMQSVQSGLKSALLEKYPGMDTQTDTAERMGPAAVAAPWGTMALCALLVIALVLIYMAIRFDWVSGLSAVIGIVHDLLVTLSLMVLLRNMIQLNLSFIAVGMAVLAYSVLSAVMTFDRIRDNKNAPENKNLSREETANRAIKENLGRTMYMALAALVLTLLLCILGTGSVREFGLPMILGILVSTYSAIMVTGYVWAFFETRFTRRKKG